MAKTPTSPEPGNAPLWSRIADTLRKEIEKGVIKPGDKLPPEMRLAHRFGVNRHTLRQAIQSLSRDGVVRVERGRGTFARSRNFMLPAAPKERIVARLLDPDGPLVGMETLSIEQGEPSAETNGVLKIRKPARVMRIDSAGYLDGRIVAFLRHCFPLPRCEGLCERIEELNSVYEALADLDFYDYCNKTTRISAEMPEPEIAERLQILPNRPILKTVTIARSTVGLAVEYSRGWYAGDFCSLDPEATD